MGYPNLNKDGIKEISKEIISKKIQKLNMSLLSEGQ